MYFDGVSSAVVFLPAAQTGQVPGCQTTGGEQKYSARVMIKLCVTMFLPRALFDRRALYIPCCYGFTEVRRASAGFDIFAFFTLIPRVFNSKFTFSFSRLNPQRVFSTKNRTYPLMRLIRLML